MSEITAMKRLVKAYHAANEYDICPGEEEHEKLNTLIIRGGIDKDILIEYEGNQPYELIDKLIDIIESLPDQTEVTK